MNRNTDYLPLLASFLIGALSSFSLVAIADWWWDYGHSQQVTITPS